MIDTVPPWGIIKEESEGKIMYLRRKIDDYLLEWKNTPGHKPLIVKGARQIGKTESILHFARQYANVVTINFALEPKFRGIIDDGYDAEAIVKLITLLDPSKAFVPHETLLVFDELQDFPDIATALKSFCLDGRYDVICSGSLLGIHYRKIHSNSVGYKTDYEMYSMDFEEFLWARGYDETHVAELLTHMVEGRPFAAAALRVWQSLFLDYCVLGGMPAVVRSFARQGNFSGTLALQRQLLLDYEEDIRKYVGGMDQTRLLSVYRSIPAQLARENKKFQFSRVAKSARAREYQGCVDWLRDTGIVNVCYCLNFPELPLKGNYDETKFKLYFADTGLLVASLDEEAQEDLRANRNLGVYKGALYENFCAEAFHKSGLELCYYRREDATLEEDFFVRTASELIPVEVKAGSGASKSLRALIESGHYPDIHGGIKLNGGNVGYAEQIHTFPYFCAFLIKRYLRER